MRLGAVAVVLSALALTQLATAPPARAGGIGDLVDELVCTYVQSDSGAAAGKRIIGRLSRNRLRTDGILISAAIWSAQEFCPAAVGSVTDAVTAAFAERKTPRVAPAQVDVAATLRRIGAELVAQELRSAGIRATRASVQRSAGAICARLARGESPAVVGGELAAQYRVGALGGLSGVVGRTQNCSRPPLPWQADALLGALSTALVANTYRSDVEPPVVELGAPSAGAVQANGRRRLEIAWRAVDGSGGPVSAEAWVGWHGGWYPVTMYESSAVVEVSSGEDYLFAVRARDAAGNTSGWYFSGLVRA